MGDDQNAVLSKEGNKNYWGQSKVQGKGRGVWQVTKLFWSLADGSHGVHEQDVTVQQSQRHEHKHYKFDDQEDLIDIWHALVGLKAQGIEKVVEKYDNVTYGLVAVILGLLVVDALLDVGDPFFTSTVCCLRAFAFLLLFNNTWNSNELPRYDPVFKRYWPQHKAYCWIRDCKHDNCHRKDYHPTTLIEMAIHWF